MRSFFAFVFIAFNAVVYGITAPEKDSITDNKLCVKIAPLSLINNPGGTSVRLGIEKKLVGNKALYFELGTFVSIYSKPYTNDRGILSRIEYKCYLNKKGISSGNYFSFECFYKNQSYNTYDSIRDSPNNYKKQYSVSKNVLCLNVKYGKMIISKKGFLFEVFAAAGIRLKDANSDLTSYENKNIMPDGDSGENIFSNKSGRFIYPNLDIGIKIGYRIR